MAKKYKKDVIRNDRLFRDQDVLKAKLDSVVNVKKPTEDPSILDTVRNAKNLARNILCKVNATLVRDESNENSDGSVIDSLAERKGIKSSASYRGKMQEMEGKCGVR